MNVNKQDVRIIMAIQNKKIRDRNRQCLTEYGFVDIIESTTREDMVIKFLTSKANDVFIAEKSVLLLDKLLKFYITLSYKHMLVLFQQGELLTKVIRGRDRLVFQDIGSIDVFAEEFDELYLKNMEGEDTYYDNTLVLIGFVMYIHGISECKYGSYFRHEIEKCLNNELYMNNFDDEKLYADLEAKFGVKRKKARKRMESALKRVWKKKNGKRTDTNDIVKEMLQKSFGVYLPTPCEFILSLANLVSSSRID